MNIDNDHENIELQRQILELELKKANKEIDLLERSSRKPWWKSGNTLAVGVIVAVFSLAGTILASLLEAQNALVLENKKFQSQLILEAIKTGNKDQALENLAFLVEMDWIDEPAKSNIRQAIIDFGVDIESPIIPVLPSPHGVIEGGSNLSTLVSKCPDGGFMWTDPGFDIGADGNPEPVGRWEYLKVGWWNLRDFSKSSRERREIELTAEVINAMDLDILALGELNDTEAIEELVLMLEGHWRVATTTDKVGSSPSSAKYYGFLWNTLTVNLTNLVNVYDDVSNDFIYDPSWATFSSLDGKLDLTLIAVHITWGDSVSDRREEIRKLPKVWNSVQAETLNDNDLILLGDFNLNIDDMAFTDLLNIPGMMRMNNSICSTKVDSSATYDQAFLSSNTTSEWHRDFGIYPFDIFHFQNDIEAAILAVSDHRPIFMSFRIPGFIDD